MLSICVTYTRADLPIRLSNSIMVGICSKLVVLPTPSWDPIEVFGLKIGVIASEYQLSGLLLSQPLARHYLEHLSSRHPL